MIKFYGYDKCSTCRKAKKILSQLDKPFESFDITKTPPSAVEIKEVHRLSDLPITKLINTSGRVYRELNLKNKIQDLSDSQIYDLLSQNGMLIKRPFVFSQNKATLGLKEELFLDAWQ